MLQTKYAMSFSFGKACFFLLPTWNFCFRLNLCAQERPGKLGTGLRASGRQGLTRHFDQKPRRQVDLRPRTQVSCVYRLTCLDRGYS